MSKAKAIRFQVTLTLTREDGPWHEAEYVQEALESELDAMQLWVDDTSYAITATGLQQVVTAREAEQTSA